MRPKEELQNSEKRHQYNPDTQHNDFSLGRKLETDWVTNKGKKE